MAAAVLLRLALSLVFVGHIADINCFMAWGNAVVTGGTSNFYTSGMFADYPPGYMYVCGALSWLSGLLASHMAVPALVFLFKLPGDDCDLVSAYLIYRIARRQGIREIFALILLGLGRAESCRNVHLRRMGADRLGTDARDCRGVLSVAFRAL